MLGRLGTEGAPAGTFPTADAEALQLLCACVEELEEEEEEEEEEEKGEEEGEEEEEGHSAGFETHLTCTPG